MNTFCEYRKDEIKKEFNIPVDVFVSRKEKLVNFAFESFFSILRRTHQICLYKVGTKKIFDEL